MTSSYVRHPMYSAFFVIGIGFVLLSANWLVGIVYLGPLLVMYAARVALEEKMMLDRFGEAYRQQGAMLHLSKGH